MRVACRRNRIVGASERRREAVPAGREHVATMVLDRTAHELVVSDEGATHLVRNGLPPAGAALDVGEQERHRPRRNLPHEPGR